MDIIYRLIENTAWQMTTPKVFSEFHLLALALTITLAGFAARFFAKRYSFDNICNERNEGYLCRILVGAGVILLVLEIYKQLFVFHVLGNDSYNWWYFPFQLCSVPMYLCLIMPLSIGILREAFLSFLSTFTLVGAVAALVFPEDFLRPYVALTIHGFVWHGILLFISLVILFTSGSSISSISSFINAATLFICLCVIAILINTLVPDAYMFYMNPLRISPQPLVSSVQERLGIPIGLILYSGAIIAAAWCVQKTHTLLEHRKFH